MRKNSFTLGMGLQRKNSYQNHGGWICVLWSKTEWMLYPVFQYTVVQVEILTYADDIEIISNKAQAEASMVWREIISACDPNPAIYTMPTSQVKPCKGLIKRSFIRVVT